MAKTDTKQLWRINRYRAIQSLNDGCLGSPVWQVWADDNTIHDAKPDNKYWLGSNRNGEVLYATEEEAWAALLAEFDEWAAKRRALIVARGKQPESPKPAKKTAKKGSRR